MKYAFVTGMGRSGTKFLSGLLALDKSIHSYHEYFGNREYWLLSWYLGDIYSNGFLKHQLRRDEHKFDKELFIDVNSYLANSIESLNVVFDEPQVFHLVRHPKKVIPSIMTRRDDGRMHQVPKTDLEIKKWINMSKLEQVCTNWVQTTEKLLSTNTTLLKFENLTTDYTYVNNQLLEPLKIDIPKDVYEKFKTKKINKTRGKIYRYLYAKYKSKNFVSDNFSFDDLSKEEKAAFYAICGSTMAKLNYE